MHFEFDQEKSAKNKAKHGIDFMEAQKLWFIPGIEIPSSYPTEARWLIIAKLDDKLWTAIFTRRGENIRIVSVRRSRKLERELYNESQEA